MGLVQEADEHFLAGAPQRFVGTWEIDQPAEAVWAELTNDQPLSWCRALSIGWTSPRPFGLGTTRTAKVLGGALVVEEKYFIWEEGPPTPCSSSPSSTTPASTSERRP